MRIAVRINKLEEAAAGWADRVVRGLGTIAQARQMSRRVDPMAPSAEELAAMAQLALYYQTLADSLRRRSSRR